LSCTTYFAGDTVVHRLDPRVRIIVTLVFSFLIAFSREWSALVAGAGSGVALCLLARIAGSALARRLLRVNIFMAVVLLLVPWTVPGRPLFSFLSVSYSLEGFLWSLSLIMRANAIVLMFTALLGTVELFTLGHAFQHLRVPGKLVHLFMFTVRYVDVLHHEYEALLRAMKTRAFRPGMNLHTYGSYGSLMGMLLVRSLERSERILAAMKCRGFRGRFHIFRHFEFHGRDLLFAVVSLVVLLGLGFVEFAGR
jgi:cobalt/nickel transport system permease protein